MRLTLRVFGYELLVIELLMPEDEEYVSNLGGSVEHGPGDDGTRYAPGFSEDDCFERVTTGFGI